MQAPKSMPNTSFIWMMLLAAVSSFATAILIFTGDYLTIGYQQNARGTAIAGTEIWDLHQVFVVLTVVIYLVALICLAWPKLFGKLLSLSKALAMLVLLVFVVFTFFPKPFEFQLRHYQSASIGTYVLLAQNSADFVDGNEGAFTGRIQATTVESFYDQEGNVRNFNCITNDAWWWGKLAVKHHFYPNLDDANHLKLLESRCQETTHD